MRKVQGSLEPVSDAEREKYDFDFAEVVRKIHDEADCLTRIISLVDSIPREIVRTASIAQLRALMRVPYNEIWRRQMQQRRK